VIIIPAGFATFRGQTIIGFDDAQVGPVNTTPAFPDVAQS
jgi:hypothetical protein